MGGPALPLPRRPLQKEDSMTKGSLLSLVSAGLGAVLLAACGSGSTTTPVTSKSPSSNNSTVAVAEAPLSGPNWFFPVMGLSAS